MCFSSKAKAQISTDNFYVKSVGIRYAEESSGYGVRFIVRMDKTEFNTAEQANQNSAVIILPEMLYDGTKLIKTNDKALKIDVTNDWKQAGGNENEMEAVAYIYNIPTSCYGMKFVAKGFMESGSGDNYSCFYTNASPATSMTDVAKTAPDDKKEQVSGYIVTNATVKYKNGETTTTEDAAYGNLLTEPSHTEYEDKTFIGWKAKNGAVWDFTEYTAQANITLTATYVDCIGNIIDNSLYSANGIVVSESTENVPGGFKKIAEYTAANYIHGQYFSAVRLDNYSEVHFALKTDGNFNFNNEKSDSSHGWLYFSLTQNTDATWHLIVTDSDGTKVYEKLSLSGHKGEEGATGVYTNQALNAILYGCPAGFMPQNTGSTLTIYFTEVRATAKPVDAVGEIVDNSLYSANGVVVSESAETIPGGYERIAEYTVNDDYIHGKLYSAVCLDNYSEVHFALKTDGNFNFNNEKSDSSHGWLYFGLTQNTDATWHLIVTDSDGTKVYENSSLSGQRQDDVYTNQALNSILYGCPSGFMPVKTENSLTVYFTEVRGSKK